MTNWFERHVTVRAADYAWAYRLRLDRMRRRPDPRVFQKGPGRAILLIPGVYETWHFLETVGAYLFEHGHPVYAIPELGRNLGEISDMASLASAYLVEHDLRNVAIVAHSKGGLIGKTLMLTDVGRERIASMVAINSPFAGSDYAHLVPIRTLREFVPSHRTIRSLSAETAINSRITSIFSQWDPIVPNGSTLDGATNLELPIGGHFRILDRPDLLAAVERAVRD